MKYEFIRLNGTATNQAFRSRVASRHHPRRYGTRVVRGFTKNISSTGVLFTSGTAADLGGPIEYVIKLNEVAPQPVSLRCVGKAVRSEPTYAGGENRLSFAIAATLERYEFVRAPHPHLTIISPR